MNANLLPQVRFQVSALDGAPRVIAVETPKSEQLFHNGLTGPARNPAKEITVGSVTVQIFGRAPGPFTIAWRECAGGPRKRGKRSTYQAARRFAEKKATDLANGQVAMDQFTEADRASHRRVLELTPQGQSPEFAMGVYAHIVQMLGDVRPEDAIAYFLENRPKGYTPKPLPELVTEFLAARKPEISEAWFTALSNPLNRLAAHFAGPLHAFNSPEINSWVRGLKDKKGKLVGSRTRHNYRAALEQLVRWAQSNGHLPRSWSELSHVPDPGAKFDSEIKTLTPEQTAAFLAGRQHAEECGRAQNTMIPFFALQLFAGVRHEEMCSKTKKVLLDWRDIHLEKRFIYICKGAAKTGRDRVIPMSDNLAAWLTPYAKRSGPIASLRQISGAITSAKQTAGIDAGRNETRNILRKTFISYRLALVKNIAQVAEEAGNSAAKIRSNYNRPVPEAEAKRHFDIWPTQASILQLNFALQ